MAPTMISWNKLLGYRQRNEKLDDKLVIDEFGNPTKDPLAACSLHPIGQYKGFGLATMVELLCGILTNRHAIWQIYSCNVQFTNG